MKNLEYNKKINSIFMFIISLFTVASVVFLSTVAYFMYDVWAENDITLAGPVVVSCAGGSLSGYLDISGSGNLEISVPDLVNTSVLMPNMPVGLRANAKIHAADSIAVLRAKVEVEFTNKEDFTSKSSDDFTNLSNSFIASLEHSDTVSSNWFKHNGYWYYVGTYTRSGADTRLVIINHDPIDTNTTCDYVDSDGNSFVKFIDNDFRIPKDIDATWSGLEVIVKITFEAVQGFIPNTSGVDIGDENKTIAASQPLFNDENVSD